MASKGKAAWIVTWSERPPKPTAVRPAAEAGQVIAILPHRTSVKAVFAAVDAILQLMEGSDVDSIEDYITGNAYYAAKEEMPEYVMAGHNPEVVAFKVRDLWITVDDEGNKQYQYSPYVAPARPKLSNPERVI